YADASIRPPWFAVLSGDASAHAGVTSARLALPATGAVRRRGAGVGPTRLPDFGAYAVWTSAPRGSSVVPRHRTGRGEA
ncbi:hypothetical protein, partial [Streptomyces flavidovirens]